MIFVANFESGTVEASRASVVTVRLSVALFRFGED